jgi:hypothetical protein
MPATVTNLTEWKAAHPPILMLWNAQCRFVSAWSVACFKLALAPLVPQIPNGDG